MERMKAARMALLAASVTGGLVSSPNGVVLAEGNPPLTQQMVRQLAGVLTYVLDSNLTGQQYVRFEQGVIRYWKQHDRVQMDQVISNLKYAGQPAELESLRHTGQQALIEAYRMERQDPVSAVLVESYDAAHSQADRRVKGFADLAGMWKRSFPDGRTIGVSYTDSGVIEISTRGTFKYTKVHNQCSGTIACCTKNGSTEEGVVSFHGSVLVFDVRSGSELVEDGCAPPPMLKSQRAIQPHKERYKLNGAMLCTNSASGAALCFAKQ